MADDKDKADETETAAPAAKLSMVQLIILVVLLAATQAGVAFGMEMLRPPPPPAAGAEAAEVLEPPSEPANYLPLDPALVVNFQHAGQGRFLQTSVQLMTRDTKVFDAAKIHSPAIRSALIMLFGNVDFEKIITTEGKKELQEEARLTAEEVLKELAGVEGIDALYLTSFVVQ